MPPPIKKTRPLPARVPPRNANLKSSGQKPRTFKQVTFRRRFVWPAAIALGFGGGLLNTHRREVNKIQPSTVWVASDSPVKPKLSRGIPISQPYYDSGAIFLGEHLLTLQSSDGNTLVKKIDPNGEIVQTLMIPGMQISKPKVSPYDGAVYLLVGQDRHKAKLIRCDGKNITIFESFQDPTTKEKFTILDSERINMFFQRDGVIFFGIDIIGPKSQMVDFGTWIAKLNRNLEVQWLTPIHHRVVDHSYEDVKGNLYLATSEYYPGQTEITKIDKNGKSSSFEVDGPVLSFLPDGSFLLRRDPFITLLFNNKGEELWRKTDADQIEWAISTPNEKIVLSGLFSPIVQCISTVDGRTIWETSIQDQIYTKPQIGKNGLIYVLGNTRGLFCLHPETGKILWQINPVAKKDREDWNQNQDSDQEGLSFLARVGGLTRGNPFPRNLFKNFSLGHQETSPDQKDSIPIAIETEEGRIYLIEQKTN